MKNRKFIAIIAVLLAVVMVACCACSKGKRNGDDSDNTSKPSIRLRSDASQQLKEGDRYIIMYSTANTESSVTFTSSDENVVSVDRFATVTAVGAGQATVTLALTDDATVSAQVTFTVTRNNFMVENGYYNGSIDFGEQDKGGDVTVRSGQVQLLANAQGESWYFKTHIDYKGFTNNDPGGFWGVGSFLVNSANPIGHTMFWYMLRRTTESHIVSPYYGGWRYATTVTANHEEAINDETYNVTNGVDFTIIRVGIRHYVIAEFVSAESRDGFKFAYDIPLFEGLSTFPGVFSQNQQLTVSDYEMSVDTDFINQKLESFQLAESVTIDGLSSVLTHGTYNLVSTVMPEITINKSVVYSLKTAVAGVSITADGVLTVADSVAENTSFTVVSTAVSDTAVKGERTYTVIAKPESTSQLFDTGMTIKASTALVSYSATGATVSVNDGDAYIPLKANGDVWQFTATLQNRKTGTQTNGTKLGIMAATAGFTQNISLGIDCNYSRKNDITLSIGGQAISMPQSAVGTLTNAATNTLSLVKDGGTYYVFINGKLVGSYSGFDFAAIPVLYAQGTGVYFTNVSVETTASVVRQFIAAQKLYVGSYVEMNGNEYVIAGIDQGGTGASTDTYDWPPDNNYNNGIKSVKSFTGSYSIEFTINNVAPLALGNGSYDAKILVYLKSERTTSSLQFTIKKDIGTNNVVTKFVSNLDDATWTEYDLPSGIDLLSGKNAIKVVKTADCVELYINGAQVYKDELFMQNTGYWNNETVSTPGIGTFLCGMTVSDVAFTAVG